MKKRKLPFWCSCVVMGSGQLMYRQWIKGLLYLGCLALYLYYLFTSGITDIIGFFTLGTVEGDPWLGIQGDDSILMLLRGIMALLVTAGAVGLHILNIRDVAAMEDALAREKTLPGFREIMRHFVDRKFYVVALFLPIVGVLIFNVLPIL